MSKPNWWVKNRAGRFAVRCGYSNRWLEFHPRSTPQGSSEIVVVDVMTEVDDRQRRLARLVVRRADLEAVLGRVTPHGD